jgi:hypothetical protein
LVFVNTTGFESLRASWLDAKYLVVSRLFEHFLCGRDERVPDLAECLHPQWSLDFLNFLFNSNEKSNSPSKC